MKGYKKWDYMIELERRSEVTDVSSLSIPLPRNLGLGKFAGEGAF